MTSKELEAVNKQDFSLINWFRTPPGICLLAAVTISALYLALAHTVHVLSVLPFLMILLCPLLHLFMMRGMHGQGGHSHAGRAPADSSDEENAACH